MKKTTIILGVFFCLFVSCATSNWDKETAKAYFMKRITLSKNDSNVNTDDQQKICDCLIENTVPKYKTQKEMEADVVKMKSTLQDCTERVLEREHSYAYISELDSVVKARDRKCPVKINNNMYLDSIYVANKLGIASANYNCRLVHTLRKDINVQQFKDSIKLVLKNEYQYSEAFKYYKDHNILLIQHYVDANRIYITSVNNND